MKLHTTIILLFSFTNPYAQCPNNLLTNGSFTSAKGREITANGWEGTSTPDINDEYGPLETSVGYVWISGVPLPSPSGGTWQNFCSSQESVSQTVNVIPGQQYTLRFEYTSQAIQSANFTYDSPSSVMVYINEMPVYTTPVDNSLYTWEVICYTFIPSTASISLKLSPGASQCYIGIDGVCLLPNNASGSTDVQSCSMVEMPNVFTPNSDGLNDLFIPIMLASVNRAELVILDRWGAIIFQSNDLTEGWDGTANGRNCSEGVYFWKIHYWDAIENEYDAHGFVALSE